MIELTKQEAYLFSEVLNEEVYQLWYARFLSFGTDYGRLKRVVAKVPNWLEWCKVWSAEGEKLNEMAEDALSKGHRYQAKALFHSAAGSFHIGQHIFFIDEDQKQAAQQKVRQSYCKALSLYSEQQVPIRIFIPYQNTYIPGYLRLAEKSDQPLVIFVNGMDNLKEVEGHAQGNLFQQQGFNFFTFDGPGQGEMWDEMKFDANEYHKAVSAIIDWFQGQNQYPIDTGRIAVYGFSLGGYLAPVSAAYDRRICCTAGNSGLIFIGGLEGLRKLNPVWQRGVTYMTGSGTLEEAVRKFNWDIEEAPRLDVPLLFFHAGKDEVMPNPKLHADRIMQWAKGEKTLRYYEDAYHCATNYLDEVYPEMIDWLKTKLLKN